MYNNFYHGTIKKNMAIFSSIFDGLTITLSNGVDVKVPLHYAPREKFLEALSIKPDLMDVSKNFAMPIMGFELTDISFDPIRMTNSLNIMKTPTKTPNMPFMYNRVPFIIEYTLYIATNRFEDALKIVEQIFPFFSPELTIAITDVENYTPDSNITFTMSHNHFDIEFEGIMDNQRTITWEITFASATFLYQDIKTAQSITRSMVDLSIADINEKYAQFTAYVDGLGVIHEERDYNG